MDHLPRIKGATGAESFSANVPCICDPHQYDGGQFETFPTRQGFRLVEHDSFVKFILHEGGSRLDAESLARIAQLWLFFGLLAEVLKVSGITVDFSDFIRHEGENSYISTNRLPEYLHQWTEHERFLSMNERKAHYRRQQDLIIIAMNFRLHQISGNWWQEDLQASQFEKVIERYKVAIPLSIEMSFVVLEGTLDRTSRRARGLDFNKSENELLSPPLLENIKAGGWCPSEVSLILQGFDDTTAFFSSQIDRGRTRANHVECSTNKCIAYNVPTGNYITKHAMDCHGCGSVEVRAEALSSLLRTGQTPRARLHLSDTDEDLQPSVELEDTGPYIAISHVWSDGLGNARNNSLPACQILRLRSMALKLNIDFPTNNPAIWIDTLLVPVAKGPEKRLALTRLWEYYQSAAKVLVLDADLLQASCFCSREELLNRVFLSTWMRRLWTLEEGVLSRENLVFQFCDGIVQLGDLTNSENYASSPVQIGYVLNESFLGLLPELPKLGSHDRPHMRQDQSQIPIISEILHALPYRSTSKTIDETLCLAHILGIDASRLVVIDDDQLRMKEFLQILTEYHASFPMRFLFTKEPKLRLEGFRWAPASLMDLDREDIEYLSGDYKRYWSTCTDQGLPIREMSAFTLKFTDQQLKKVTFAEVDRRIFALVPVPKGQRCRGRSRFWSAEFSKEAFDMDPEVHLTTDWKAVLGTSPRNTAVIHQFYGYGMLVASSHTEGHPDDPSGSLIYARPVGQVYIYELKTIDKNFGISGANSDAIRFSNPTWDFEEMERQMRAEFEKCYDASTASFLKCVAIDPSQRWCIG